MDQLDWLLESGDALQRRLVAIEEELGALKKEKEEINRRTNETLPQLRQQLQTQLTNALQHADKCNSAWVAFEQELLEEQQLIASTPELLRRLAEGREQRLQTARQTYQTVQGRLQQAERRARDSLRRGETRATLTAVNKFLEVWHQASAEDNDNNDQCLLLLRHCSNLREYFDSTRQSLLEETKSLAERKFQLALRSLDWPKPLTKQFSQTEIINRLAGPYLLSLDSVGVSPSTQMFSSPPTPLLSPSSGLRIRSAASSPPVTGSVGGETGVTAASPAPRSSVEQRLIEMARQFLHLIDAYKLESSWTVADDKAVASKAVQRIISFMIEPIRQRLAFHFEGNRPTNRLDKAFIQPLLPASLSNDGGEEGEQLQQHRAIDEFIVSILPWLLLKISKDARDLFRLLDDCVVSSAVPQPPPLVKSATAADETDDKQSATQPSATARQTLYASSLLIHLIRESVNFDRALLDGYGFHWQSFADRILLYDAQSPNAANNYGGDPPCFALFTVRNPRWFDRWLAAETVVMQEQLKTIMQPSIAWELQYELLGDEDEMRVTRSAVALMDLMESQTEHYKHLSDLGMRLQFHQQLQRRLLESYRQQQLQVEIDKLETIINARYSLLGSWRRTAGGDSIGSGASPTPPPQEQLLIKLCRLLASVNYVVSVLRQWGDSMFFIELLAHQQQQAKSKDKDLFEKTLFSEPIEHYEQLSSQLMDHLVRVIQSEALHSFYPYERKRDWSFKHAAATNKPTPAVAVETNDSTASEESSMELSREMLNGLCTLNRLLTVISGNLPRQHRLMGKSPFHAVLRKVCQNIDKHLFDRMVLVSRFNRRGAQQFQFDVSQGFCLLIASRITAFVSAPDKSGNYDEDGDEWSVGSIYFPRLKESALVLNLAEPEATELLNRLQSEQKYSPVSIGVSPTAALLHGDQFSKILSAKELMELLQKD